MNDATEGILRFILQRATEFDGCERGTTGGGKRIRGGENYRGLPVSFTVAVVVAKNLSHA